MLHTSSGSKGKNYRESVVGEDEQLVVEIMQSISSILKSIPYPHIVAL